MKICSTLLLVIGILALLVFESASAMAAPSSSPLQRDVRRAAIALQVDVYVPATFKGWTYKGLTLFPNYAEASFGFVKNGVKIGYRVDRSHAFDKKGFTMAGCAAIYGSTRTYQFHLQQQGELGYFQPVFYANGNHNQEAWVCRGPSAQGATFSVVDDHHLTPRALAAMLASSSDLAFFQVPHSTH